MARFSLVPRDVRFNRLLQQAAGRAGRFTQRGRAFDPASSSSIVRQK